MKPTCTNCVTWLILVLAFSRCALADNSFGFRSHAPGDMEAKYLVNLFQFVHWHEPPTQASTLCFARTSVVQSRVQQALASNEKWTMIPIHEVRYRSAPEDGATTPGSTDGETAPGSKDGVTAPGPKDGVTAPGPKDGATKPTPKEVRVTIPAHRVDIRVLSDEETRQLILPENREACQILFLDKNAADALWGELSAPDALPKGLLTASTQRNFAYHGGMIEFKWEDGGAYRILTSRAILNSTVHIEPLLTTFADRVDDARWATR